MKKLSEIVYNEGPIYMKIKLTLLEWSKIYKKRNQLERK